MPECTADMTKAKESARNAFMGCGGGIVFTFALSLGSRTDGQSFSIKTFETNDAET